MTAFLPQCSLRPASALVETVRDTWVFDLDNTLYSVEDDLWPQIDLRMKTYIARFLDISPEAAFALQKDYYRRYGTSLRGLMIEHGMDPGAFLAHVHDIDLSGLGPTPRLGAAIAALPGRKIVYTNGSEHHARNVLTRLGIADVFSAVHDIVAAEFHPKPTEEAYLRFLDCHGVEPARAVMFEDLARNLEVPHRLGMGTVLVVAPGHGPATRESWELEGREAAHVDAVTGDLVALLERLALVGGRGGSPRLIRPSNALSRIPSAIWKCRTGSAWERCRWWRPAMARPRANPGNSKGARPLIWMR